MTVDPTIVREILNAEDIEGLLKLGAPSDEYSEEARSISSALRSIAASDVGEEAMVSIFRETWSRSFGPISEEQLDMRAPAFRRASRLILNRVV